MKMVCVLLCLLPLQASATFVWIEAGGKWLVSGSDDVALLEDATPKPATDDLSAPDGTQDLQDEDE